MHSQFESESLALRANLITIDRPDSSQVDQRTTRVDDSIVLARGFTCLHYSETCLERPTESRRERSDGTGRLRWFRSVSLSVGTSRFSADSLVVYRKI